MSETSIVERDMIEVGAPDPSSPVRLPAGQLAHPATPKSDAQSLMDVIGRAASDPMVDIAKMERLVALRRDMLADEAKAAFNAAMTAAQREMHPIAADANNPQTKSRYATYAKLDAALRPIYTAHGFALSFDEGDSPKPEHIRVICYVSHDAGHTRDYHKDMPADGKGAKGGDVMTKTHAAGAAQSYGMRYLLKGIFNVAVGEDDRDGNAPADHGGAITAEQVAWLKTLIDETGADQGKFCAYLKVGSLEEIPAKDYSRATAALAAKRRKAPKQEAGDVIR